MSDLFNTGVRPAIDSWLLAKSQERRDYQDYWSASSAGYCQRKVIFERLGIPHVEKEDDARKQRLFTAGHLFHDWIQGITKAAGISIAQELELQDEDLMVRGHFDDLVLIGSGAYFDEESSTTLDINRTGHLILYDYKTRNSKNFNYAKRPSYFHRLQLGTYMYMLRKRGNGYMAVIEENEDKPPFDVSNLTEARILSIEKDTLRMAEVQYMWDEKLEKDVVDYWTSLNKHWADKTLPPCTCDKHEGGFMALEKWNPFFYKDKPCSLEWFTKHPEQAKKWRAA